MSRYKNVVHDGKYTTEHRLVWEAAHGPIPKGYEIHHKDGNSKNNALENLMCLTVSEHRRIHAEMRAKGIDVIDLTDPNVIKDRRRQKKYRSEHLEEVRAKCAKYNRDNRERIDKERRKKRAENREEVLRKEASYRDSHRDQCRESQRKYRSNNLEKCRESSRKWARENNRKHRALLSAKMCLSNAIKRGADPEKIASLQERVRVETYKDQLATLDSLRL